MAAISQTAFTNAFSWMKSFAFFIQISVKFILKCPIDNKTSLIQDEHGIQGTHPKLMILI